MNKVATHHSILPGRQTQNDKGLSSMLKATALFFGH